MIITKQTYGDNIITKPVREKRTETEIRYDMLIISRMYKLVKF